MHTQTIFELSQEAERLLQLALNNLDSLKSMPIAKLDSTAAAMSGVNNNVLPLHFSARGVDAQQAMLNNELRKITRLEMVLAIVGTMKAGKSTTINAIVGTEVLPNRNRPMTALPTLIRHTPGQKEPVLHFLHVAPIDTLIAQLQKKLCEKDRGKLARRLEIDKDMTTLLERIERGEAFEKHHLGAEPIFHCLKSLNDLVRLSQALGVEFPFSEYAVIEHIPVIEVEFVHLAGLDAHLGQLTLLDTPGPNEAGQPHLQKMLSEQLARASAVLAVMDYTQLKSISDAEVRQAISAAGKSVPLYALVNKFDQKDRNSDDEEQVRAMISGTLMKGNISPGQIYPVSSMWAYLANRARYEMNVHGRLPDHQDQRWVQDFAEAALGRRWRTADLDDIDHIRHAADLLWEDSLFEQPIRKLIYAAYANASLFALRSASHKLLNYAQNAREYLDFRHQGLTVAFDELELNIARLEEDMTMLRQRQSVVSDEVQHEVEEALNATDAFLLRQKGELHQALGDIFSRPFILDLAGREPSSLRTDDADAIQQLVLDDEGQAQIVLSKIRSSCEQILLSAQSRIGRELALRFDQLESTLARSLNEAMRPIETRIKEQLSHAGFRARISFPAFQANQLNFNTRSLFNDAIVQDTPPASQPAGAGSVRDTVSRWLNNPGWGWEEYVVTRTRYVIDIAQLHGKFTQHTDQFCDQIRKALAAQVDVSVTAGMATFFAEFSLCLTGLQESLRDSLAVRQQNEHSTRALSQLLKQSMTTAAWIQEDTRLLRDDIQTLFAAEQP
ncbi:clamp-binding protein CrfC [Enterobacter hormaechei]|uniref:clamp-binding protein CrfC n=1 Tax=Enterobacter hormaechei TaxID=158836 RepID=UPI0020B71823|nr:clamp-binding protein CrfC [Enterobacter hormaechei]MCP3816489.1 clamp-binding protein CrfC [Enterobacter hormaechei]MCP3827141.1 clamp-binding protein CrfC [Enterobacter hormaechei]MCW4627255.1 clamp-binding protein CrfC [Enterobacter hormaechei]